MEQFLAVITMGFLLVAWRILHISGDKSDRIFFTILFSLTLTGVFTGGVLNLF